MKDRSLALWKQWSAMWGGFSLAKRLVLALSVIGVVAAVLGGSAMSTRETYTYLFTELSTEDASAIATKLKELKVPYRVEAGGTAISVLEERVHEVRLELAGQGLPRGGGVGFEIFDKTHLGSTEFEQHINLRRALEGELGRTISTIGSVQSARVHLVLPEHSVFAIHQQEASASVVLRLRPARPFGRQEIASVVHLVASAVPGLSADRVSIVSADGLMLHKPRSEASGGAMGGGDAQADREKEITTALEEQARAMLERVVGPGHADVRIGITLDASVRERTEEHYEPAKTALRSEQHSEERATAEGATIAGVPGAASNLPTATPEPASSTGSQGAFRTSFTRNWEVDRVTEKTTLPAGRISRLSVAVLVDGKYTGEKKEYAARDKVELDRLAELVKSAVGFSAERGDVVQMECAPFARPDELEPPPAEVDKLRKVYLPYGGAGLAGVVILALLVSVLRTKRQSLRQQRQILELSVAEQPSEAMLTAATSEINAALPPGLTTGATDPSVVRQQALDIAMRDPATAAIILRNWLNGPSANA